MTRSLRFCWLTAGWLLISGCSRSEPSVSGAVRLDGKPLLSGSIRFVPIDGTPGGDAGAGIESGDYSIEKGLRVGKYRVEIQGTKESEKEVRNPYSPAEFIKAVMPIVPKEYNERSKIIREVSSGSNTLDFDLLGGGAQK